MTEQPLDRMTDGQDIALSVRASRSRGQVAPEGGMSARRAAPESPASEPVTSQEPYASTSLDDTPPTMVRLHMAEGDGAGTSASTMRASRGRRARRAVDATEERSVGAAHSHEEGYRPQHAAASSLETRRVRGTERAPRHGSPAPSTAQEEPQDTTTSVRRPRAHAKRRTHGETHFVVRNTHDYDHEDQTARPVRSHERFEHLDPEEGQMALVEERTLAAHRGTGEPISAHPSRWRVALVVMALVLGAAVGIVTYGMELWGGKSMPYVLGESQVSAERALAAKGLAAVVEERASDDAIGKVVAQEPQTGERVPEGGEVHIYIATSRIIPEVVGLSEAEAREELQKAGAATITVVEQPSEKKEGTVIDVSPEQGKSFISRKPVTLTIAGSYHVPDVVGLKEVDALAAIEDAGLASEVQYVSSKKTVRTVVKTSPKAGKAVGKGAKVVLKVSSPYPTGEYQLAEFFSHSTTDLDTYLQSKGFGYEGGAIDNTNSAIARYTSYGQGTITFSSQPYKHYLSLPAGTEGNVMAQGTGISGVRLDTPVEMVPYGADRSDLENIAAACGLTNSRQFCTNADIKLPAGTHAITCNWQCLSGSIDKGDLVWTVLRISNGGIVRVAVTCAKSSIYEPAQLALLDGTVCQYVAYQEVYLSSEYWVVEKKETKKTKKKTSSKSSSKTTTTTESKDSSGSSDSD